MQPGGCSGLTGRLEQLPAHDLAVPEGPDDMDPHRDPDPAAPAHAFDACDGDGRVGRLGESLHASFQ